MLNATIGLILIGLLQFQVKKMQSSQKSGFFFQRRQRSREAFDTDSFEVLEDMLVLVEGNTRTLYQLVQ